MNGAMCSLTYGAGFECHCPPGMPASRFTYYIHLAHVINHQPIGFIGYTGELCDTELTPCSPNPCPSRSICVPQGFTDHICACGYGFMGKLCNEGMTPPVVSRSSYSCRVCRVYLCVVAMRYSLCVDIFLELLSGRFNCRVTCFYLSCLHHQYNI